MPCVQWVGGRCDKEGVEKWLSKGRQVDGQYSVRAGCQVRKRWEECHMVRRSKRHLARLPEEKSRGALL